MRIFIQSKTLAVTEAIAAFTTRHLKRLEKRNSSIEAVTVFLDAVARKKNDVTASIARIRVSLPGKDVVVERRATNLYDAIVDASQRIAERVRASRERRLAKHQTKDWESLAKAVLPIEP